MTGSSSGGAPRRAADMESSDRPMIAALKGSTASTAPFPAAFPTALESVTIACMVSGDRGPASKPPPAAAVASWPCPPVRAKGAHTKSRTLWCARVTSEHASRTILCCVFECDSTHTDVASR